MVVGRRPDDRSVLERLTIRETEDGLGVHVPAVKNVPLILFLLVWLCGWAAGEWFALGQIFDGRFHVTDVFLAVWATLWTLGGLGAMLALGWQLAGTERLFVTSGALVVEKGFAFFRRRKVWNPGDAGNFRRGQVGVHTTSVVGSNGIAFDAGGRTHHFGASLNSVEASALLAAIARHLPDTTHPGAARTTGAT